MPTDIPNVSESQRNLLRTEGFLADDIPSACASASARHDCDGPGRPPQQSVQGRSRAA
jgi:hypothetical protein